MDLKGVEKDEQINSIKYRLNKNIEISTSLSKCQTGTSRNLKTVGIDKKTLY